MERIIAIANQKGGVGKTTTTLNLAVGLQKSGKKVLCIDFDPQCHLAKYIGHQADPYPTITDCLFAKASYYGELPTEGLIRHSKFDIDYIPASLKLSKADMVLSQAMFREQVLRDVLEQLPLEGYDYILIDCNPSMGVLLTNALIAADGVIIPVQAEDFAVDGLEDMIEIIRIIRQQANPNLKILGLLPTMVSLHTRSSAAILQYLYQTYPDWALQTCITRSVAATESVRANTPLIGGKSKLGEQYMQFTRELLSRIDSEAER